MMKQDVDYNDYKLDFKKYSIKFLKQGHHLSLEQVLGYLGNSKNVLWVKAENLLGELNDACVDGRETEWVIASPGGDMAILGEAIISVGKLVNRYLDEVEIRQIFNWRLKKMGSFYYHTDTHALENLMKSLNEDEKVGRKFKSVSEVLKLVKKPLVKVQSVLITHLLKTENIGCGHLKLMLAEPGAYGMSRKVLQGILRVYFNMMWNGTKKEKKLIKFRVLEGEHNEGAVAVIRVKGRISKDSLVPAVRPTDGKMSMFVFHPQVTEFMHDNLAMEMAKSGLVKEIGKRQVREFKGVMSKVNTEGLRETVSRLAFGLPMYTFEFEAGK